MDKFEMHLRQGNMANNTIVAYKYAVNDFNGRYKELNKKNLLLYKTYLIENFKPKTVNLRIQALNKYLDYLGKVWSGQRWSGQVEGTCEMIIAIVQNIPCTDCKNGRDSRHFPAVLSARKQNVRKSRDFPAVSRCRPFSLKPESQKARCYIV